MFEMILVFAFVIFALITIANMTESEDKYKNKDNVGNQVKDYDIIDANKFGEDNKVCREKARKYNKKNDENIVFLGKKLLAQKNGEVFERLELNVDKTLGTGKINNEIYLSEELRGRHMIVTGTTGSGKTETLINIMLQDAQNGRGFFFVDAKGHRDTFKKIQYHLNRLGVEKELHYVNPSDPETSSKIDLFFGTPAEIRDRIIQSFEFSEQNPFFKSFSEKYLLVVIKAFESLGKPYNFQDLYKATENQQGLEELMELVDDKEIEMSLSSYLADWEDTMKYSKDLNNQLYEFSTGNMGKVVNSYNPDLNLLDVYKENKLVYVALSARRLATNLKLGKLLVKAFGHLSAFVDDKEEIEPKFFNFTADEFAKLTKQSFADWIARARSSKISINMGTQSLVDLEMFSKVTKGGILENTNLRFHMKANTDETVKQIADSLQKKQEWQESYSESESQETFEFVESRDSKSVSKRLVEKYRVRPEVIANSLGVGEGLLVNKTDTFLTADFVKSDYYVEAPKEYEVKYPSQKSTDKYIEGVNMAKRMLGKDYDLQKEIQNVKEVDTNKEIKEVKENKKVKETKDNIKDKENNNIDKNEKDNTIKTEENIKNKEEKNQNEPQEKDEEIEELEGFADELLNEEITERDQDNVHINSPEENYTENQKKNEEYSSIATIYKRPIDIDRAITLRPAHYLKTKEQNHSHNEEEEN